MKKAAKQRTLSHAPITEALIDFRVTLSKEARTMEYLAGLDERFRELYPEKKEIKKVQFKLNIDGSPGDEKTSTQLGFRYANTTGTQVIQAGIDGFTCSRLPPYEDWEKLKEEAERTWKIYSDYVRPETITRVATRYINKLVLPGPSLDFDDYLRYIPKVPAVLPQIIGPFFSRIVAGDPPQGLTVIITQSYQHSPTEVSVVLDIDAYSIKEFMDEREAWNVVDRLRDFKNRIFFDCITEKTAKLFE